MNGYLKIEEEIEEVKAKLKAYKDEHPSKNIIYWFNCMIILFKKIFYIQIGSQTKIKKQWFVIKKLS